ncbi:hypothetical protein SAMD00019534_031760 [Acytostelium subglobosum LB1]|uniref:hypothetical protein n=1 Tax=Acytostelium subglobosum LB1 TaxID=1410327 RepID=UPI000644B95C|nr:hypothetical protein SAMD00019534_031760 [Acytostelium subglobosum LB1]GAM20001.1 hypothetical protein SAMD00019534_031760 [Acytostelium subglobosum LB1]|eukprot:XP_012756763.1 hypothetical protein SAMD00019534_031760 [Acytostelium subglobosum LB1]
MGQGLSTYTQFPYVIGTPITSYQGKSIWTLHTGTKKDDGSPVSIFSFDIKKSPAKIDVAKNGFKRAKTIRHPNFLTYLDGIELETNIYIVTEPVTPLDELIDDIRKYDNAISWGVYQITKALSFANNDVNLAHGNVNTTTVFVTKAGDWKLGGLDLLCDIRDSNPILKQHGDIVPVKYKPPEITKGLWPQINTAPPIAIDSWMLGCLIYECYNGPMSKSDDVRDLSKIPKEVHTSYQKCFAAKAESRLNPSKFLECPYFNNIFVETCVFLENITLKDNFEKEAFFKKLDHHIDKIPMNICKFKILPHLITAFDFGPVNPKILGTLMKISANLSTEEYVTKVVPSVVKWFQSDDRSLRVNLLENLEHYIQHLTPAIINDQIFPNVVNGFNDKPALKEVTIKSMLLFAPKLSEKTMIQLLKYFAALQKDPEPGIRTNTTICLGRIAEHINEQTRKRVLIPAFATSLKDPFVPSQNAGLSAFMFTQGHYNAEEIATRILPEISRCLISPDKSIRATALQAMNLFIKKVETMMASIGTDQNTSPLSGSGGAQGQTHAQGGQQGHSQQGQESMLGWAYGLTKKYISPTGNENGQPSPIAPSQPHQQQASKGTSSSSSQSQSQQQQQQPKQTNTRVVQPSNTSKDSNGWDDEDELDIDEEDNYSNDRRNTSSNTSKSTGYSSSSTSSSRNTQSDSPPIAQTKGMSLVSKPKTQASKLSKFSFEEEDSNWGDNVVSPPTSAVTTKSSSGGQSDWGNGWDDEPTITTNTSSVKSLKKTTAASKPASKSVAAPSSDGWDSWDD